MLTKIVQSRWLERVMDAALAARGLAEAPRRDVVLGLLFGSLRGVDSHGAGLFRTYLAELSSGRARLEPRFTYRQRRPAIAHLDAGGALGIVAGFEATRKVAALAKDNGVGVVVVSNSNHFGAASIYTSALARDGMIGLAMTNSDALVVPVNGCSPRLGTNPISMAAAGAGEDLFCTDLATSQGSFLRSRAARAGGTGLPVGIFVDSHGVDAAISGGAPQALLPLGGHKGQCLGMMVSILCALLGAAPFDWELVNLFEGPFDQPREIAHLLLAIDVSAVTDQERFRSRLSSYLQALRATPAATGLMVSCPGDAESQTERRRSVEGIPISGEDYQLLCELERELAL